MADIAMCRGRDCPLAERCYRKQAKPDRFMQTMIAEAYDEEERACRNHWPYGSKPMRKRVAALSED